MEEVKKKLIRQKKLKKKVSREKKIIIESW